MRGVQILNHGRGGALVEINIKSKGAVMLRGAGGMSSGAVTFILYAIV